MFNLGSSLGDMFNLRPHITLCHFMLGDYCLLLLL